MIHVGGSPETGAVLFIRPARLRPGCLNARGMVHRLTLNSTFLQRNKLTNRAASGLHKHHFSEQNHDLPFRNILQKRSAIGAVSFSLNL